MIRGHSEELRDGTTTIGKELRVLREMNRMLWNMDIQSILPSENARYTLDICFKNKMAWRIAGANFRDQLLRTFELELDDKIIVVKIADKDLRYFKDAVLRYDERIRRYRAMNCLEV